MKISVITVVRNEGETIARTLESVQSQTYPGVEHIVVDGMSDDETPVVIDSFRERLSGVIREPDSGIYDAMNKGLRAARGDLIHFLNAGDVFLSEHTLSSVAWKAEMRDEDLFYGDICYGSASRAFSLRRHPACPGRMYLLRRNISHQALFCTRRAYDRTGGFDLNLRIYADYDWLLRALRCAGLTSFHLRLPVCICRDPGLSGAASALRARESIVVRLRHFTRMELAGYCVAKWLASALCRGRRRSPGTDAERASYAQALQALLSGREVLSE